MSDDAASHDQRRGRSDTITKVLDGLQPMGDLEQFVIEGLTPADADEYSRILEEA